MHRTSPRRRGLAVVALLTAATLLTACSGPSAVTVTSSVPAIPGSVEGSPASSPGPSGSSVATASSAVPSPTGTSELMPTPDPVLVPTPGELTGPGVDVGTIALGVLADPLIDRGFTQGLTLWQHTVNAAGGVCGRQIHLISAGGEGVPVDLVRAYTEIGTGVLGISTLTSGGLAEELATQLTRDGLPALTPSGTANALTHRSPTVLGPTEDVIGLGLVDHLAGSGLVPTGGTVAVRTDDSLESADVLAGIRWGAERLGWTVVTADASAPPPADWHTLPMVVVLAGPAVTAETLAAVATDTVVLTTTAGYDPALLARDPGDRLRVAQATPALASDHPGAPTVVAAFAEAGLGDPGRLLFSGWAVGSEWQRLLNTACEAGNLTRDGVFAAMASVGPAPLDGLLGAADPALPLTQGRPASLSVSIAQADLQALDGLAPLSGLAIPAGVVDYLDGQ